MIRADGSRGLVSLSAEPVRDAGGEIVAAVATLFDLTEHRQREDALAFLAEASVVLTESLDLQHTLTELVELAVPRLADWCTIDMLDHGEIRNVGVAHADPDTARLARRLHARRPVRARASSGVSAALSTGRSQLIQDVPAWLAEQDTADEELLTLSRVLGVRSSIVAPLAGRGRVFGALTLATAESGRRFSEQDLAVAEDLARRAALAIENARLYGAEHDIAHALQQSLLPGTLTQPPGAEVVARYRPAGEGAEVGGDFYDSWQTGDALLPRDRRRRRARPGSGRAHQPDPPGHARRQPLRVVAGPHPRSRQRHDPRPERARAVLHRRSGRCCARPRRATSLTVACAGPPAARRRARGAGAVEEIGVCGALLGVLAQRDYDDRACLLAPRRPRRVLDRRRDRAPAWRRHVRRGAPARAARRSGQPPRPPMSPVAVDEAVVDFAPGLPDDDVAILVARVTCAAVGAAEDTAKPRLARGLRARRVACPA